MKKVGIRYFLAVAAATILLLSTPNLSLAHTSLVGANPAAGSQINIWPTQITLEFDDQLQNLGDEKANFIVVNNAQGDQVSRADEVISGNSISVSLDPNQITGPVLVFYHVVSTDGHPVEGEYKFDFGAGDESPTVVVTQESSNTPFLIYLASGAFILSGIFFSIYSYRGRTRS